MTRERIYLDNAATSYPKPISVYQAVDTYNRLSGVPVGRGAYQQAIELQATVNRCRKRAAGLFSAETSDSIIFTFNGTDSLNLAIHGVLKPGDHVVTSVVEHNSVLRPLCELRDRVGIEVSYVNADRTGRVDANEFKDELRPNTKLIVLVHASNVTGTLQPIADVGAIARNAGVLFLVDAAQTAGHIPINVRELPIDLLACPGHKGLLGPLGTGLLYICPGVEDRVLSFRQGGTGSNSEDERQPATLPDKYEAGNHNAPGLVGLEASLAYLEDRGVEEISQHENSLTQMLLDGLEGIPGVSLYGKHTIEGRLGVVSMGVDGFEPQELASVLDQNFSIQTRAGLHCAPGVHKAIGTFDFGGTVRLSVGPMTTLDQIDAAISAIREVAGTA